MNDLENQLANDNVIQLGTFLSLCAMENLNVIYFNSTTYLEVLSTDDTETIHVICKKKTATTFLKNKNSKPTTTYGYMGLLNDELKTYKSSCYKIDTLDKPLKCISAYKVKEIEDICHLFKINIFSEENKEFSGNKKKTKTELFHYLQKHLETIL